MLSQLLTIVTSLLLIFPGIKAENLEAIQHLTISDGLEHNGVSCILEDTRGYVWIGTYEGLNRYDGYSFRIYKNTTEVHILPGNRVRCIKEDKKGNLWIGTESGISLYDYHKNKFKTIYPLKNIPIGQNAIIREIILLDDTYEILAVTEKGEILVFNANYKLTEQYTAPEIFSSLETGIHIKDQHFLFGTDKGLIHFNRKMRTFSAVYPNHTASCYSLTQLDSTHFMAATTQGLVVVQVARFNDHLTFNIRAKHLHEYSFRTSTIDQLGNLWLGTVMNGFLQILNTSQLINEETKIAFNTFKSDNAYIRASCLSTSKNTGCWAGTFGNGIYRFNLTDNPFKKIGVKNLPKQNDILKDLYLINISPDHKIVLTSRLHGSFIYDATASNTIAKSITLPGYSSNEISVVFIDSLNFFWGTLKGNLGLFRFKPGNLKITTVLPERFNPITIGIRKIKKDNYGYYWLLGAKGIIRFRIDTYGKAYQIEELNKHSCFMDNKIILARDIFIDHKFNTVWISTELNGLIRIKNSINKPLLQSIITCFISNPANNKSLPVNFVTSIISLPGDDLWIGTEGGGICHVINRENNPTFIPFTVKDGLSNNVVKNIAYINDKIWISTNKGLNALTISNGTFKQFRIQDGLPFEDFSFPSVTLPDGTLLLTGSGGTIRFNPSTLPEIRELPRLYFDELAISNTIINPDDSIGGRIIINKRLTETSKINLRYEENTFSVGLNLLHYSNPNNYYFRYKLLPVNNHWTEISATQQTLNFTELNPGDYQLTVVAVTHNNLVTNPISLSIHIAKPWWRSTIAIFLYTLTSLAVIFLIIHIIIKIKTLHHTLRIEHLEKEQAEAVNEAKLRYFSDISHEIKTPLSLILGPLGSLRDNNKGNNPLIHKIDIINRQAKKISSLIDQVNDFQKSDANRLTMNYSIFVFNEFIQMLLSDFQFAAKLENKTVSVKHPDTTIWVCADKDKLEKVINNVLNNAFKFTEPECTIEVTYYREENDIYITISDNGRGISDQDLPHIFERFYHSKKDNNKKYIGGSGIGLAFSKRLVEMHYGTITVTSEPNKETIFTIKLPIVEENTNATSAIATQKIIEAEKNIPSDEIINNVQSDTYIPVNDSISKSVLYYVEDNIELRNMVENEISKHFRIKAFSNGKACLEALIKEWPDVIITDVLMPFMNGFELCRAVKSDIKTSHIPIIMLTACTSVNDEIKGLRFGADVYLKKPFEFKHLYAGIESVLTIRKKLQERYQSNYPLELKPEDGDSKDRAFITKLYSIIDENMDNSDFDFNSIYRQLYLSRSIFFKKVKSITGYTPGELLNNIRINAAARLLASNKYNVNEVITLTGFKSRSTFNDSFKKKFNISPGKYAATMPHNQ